MPTRRLLGQEHEEIGYAFSFDGINFQRNMNNPIVRRSLNPGVGRMSEAHVFIEGGIFYVFHTIAWSAGPWLPNTPIAGPQTPKAALDAASHHLL